MEAFICNRYREDITEKDQLILKNSLNEVSAYLKRTLTKAGYDQQHMQMPDYEETGRLIRLVIKEIMKGEAGHPPLLSDKDDQNTQLKELFH